MDLKCTLLAQPATMAGGRKILPTALVVVLSSLLVSACGGGSSSSGRAIQKNTINQPAPVANSGSINLAASPIRVTRGGLSTLSWESTGSDSCTASGGWSGDQSVSGSTTVGPINSTTTYRLSCDGSSGTIVGTVTVEVVDKILRWQAPTQNVDGSPLDDLAGYVVYWGTSSRNYTNSHAINSPTATEWEATVASGSYYFAMTAIDSEDNQSGYSNEVLKFIPD